MSKETMIIERLLSLKNSFDILTRRFSDEKKFICYSGGKDSVVLAHLVSRSTSFNNKNTTLVYNKWGKEEVTEDHSPKNVIESLDEFCLKFGLNALVTFPNKEVGVELLSQFKETHYLVDGSRVVEGYRNEEGKSNKTIFDGKEVDRQLISPYTENGLGNMRTLFPIYNWTDGDIIIYTSYNNLDKYITG